MKRLDCMKSTPWRTSCNGLAPFVGQGGALGACDTPPVTPPQGWEACADGARRVGGRPSKDVGGLGKGFDTGRWF